MTTQRARAHARVIKTVRDLGPAKLHPSEQARIRCATDAMFFCADLANDRSAREAFADVQALTDQLVAGGRWTHEMVGQLVGDLWACGPGLEQALRSAA